MFSLCIFTVRVNSEFASGENVIHANKHEVFWYRSHERPSVPLGLGETFKFNHGISEFGLIRENCPKTFGYSGN